MKYTIFALIAATLIAGFMFQRNQAPNQNVQNEPSPSVIATEEVNIQAHFLIITDNTTRSFKAEKYHNKSSDVYIESSDPSLVHVTKTGITWADFFNTLPMKLTKDCLITGDGENLCNGETGELKFFLNDTEEPNLLDGQIKDGDNILVKFSSS